MEITQRDIDQGTCVITLEGTLNASSADKVKSAFVKAVEQGMRRVVLDLSKVPFMDSSGLAALVSGLKTMNSHDGSLMLAGLQPQATLLFQLTMFDKVFDVSPDVETALRSLSI